MVRESILFIGQAAPYVGHESEELGDDVVGRMNPETGEIESLEDPHRRLPTHPSSRVATCDVAGYQGGLCRRPLRS